MNFTELQDALREQIRSRRGAQAEIARRLNISTPSVAAYVTGRNRIPAEHLDVILAVLGAGLSIEGLVRTGPLQPENLTQTDPIIARSAQMFVSDGQQRMGPMQTLDLARLVLGSVPANLPSDVRHYLDRGRACIAYAGFYYPLLTVGAAQLALAVEAAIRAYAVQVNVSTLVVKAGKPDRVATITTLIDRLASAGYFDSHQVQTWRAWNTLRNALMHPGQYQVLSIGLVLPLLINFTLEFMRLFPAPENVS